MQDRMRSKTKSNIPCKDTYRKASVVPASVGIFVMPKTSRAKLLHVPQTWQKTTAILALARFQNITMFKDIYCGFFEHS